MGQAFQDGFNKSGSGNVFGAINDAFSALAKSMHDDDDVFDAARNEFHDLTREGYLLSTAIGSIIGSVSSLVGGLGGLIGVAGQALGSLGALGGVAATLGLAFGTGKLALTGVSAALKDITAATPVSGGGTGVSTSSGAESAAEKKAKSELDQLNQVQVQFAEFLVSLKPKYQELQNIAGDTFLPPLQKAMQQIVTNDLPTINKGIGELGTALGQVATGIGKALSSSSNVQKLAIIFQASAGNLVGLGEAAGNAFSAVLSLLVAVEPITRDFIDLVESKANLLSNFLDAKAADGELQTFFSNSEKAMSLFGTLAGNVFKGLGNIISAQFGVGTSGGASLLTYLDQLTGKFADLGNTPSGALKLQEYFYDTAQNVEAIIGSVGKLTDQFLKLGTNPAIGQFFTILGTGAKAMGQLGEKTEEAGPALANLVVSIVKFLNAMSDDGAIKVFFNTLEDVAKVANALINNNLTNPILLVTGRLGAAALAFGLIGKVAKTVFNTIGGEIKLVTGAVNTTIAIFAKLGTAILATSDTSGLAKVPIFFRTLFTPAAEEAAAATKTVAVDADAARFSVSSLGEATDLAADSIVADDGIVASAGALTDALTGPLGVVLAIGGAIAALAAFAGTGSSSSIAAQQNIDNLTQSLNDQTAAFTKNTATVVSNSFEKSGAFTAANKLGITNSQLVGAALGNQADKALVASLATDRLTQYGAQLTAQEKAGTISTQDAYNAFDKLQKTVDKVTGAVGTEASEATKAQAAHRAIAAGVDAASGAYTKYAKATAIALTASNGVAKASGTVNQQYKEFATVAGAAAKAGLTYINDTKGQTSNATQIADAEGQVVDQLITMAANMGITGKAADTLVSHLLGIPTKTVITLQTNTSDIIKDIDGVKTTLDALGQDAALASRAGVTITYSSKANALGGFYQYANGGINTGLNSGIYSGTPGGILKFAEPETGWEAFISGKTGQTERNQNILNVAAKKLGMQPNVVGAGSVSVPITVVAGPGQSVTAVATEVSRQLAFKLRKGANS